MNKNLLKVLSATMLVPVLTLGFPVMPQASAKDDHRVHELFEIGLGEVRDGGSFGCGTYDAGSGVSCMRCYYTPYSFEDCSYATFTICDNGYAEHEEQDCIRP